MGLSQKKIFFTPNLLDGSKTEWLLKERCHGPYIVQELFINYFFIYSTMECPSMYFHELYTLQDSSKLLTIDIKRSETLNVEVGVNIFLRRKNSTNCDM